LPPHVYDDISENDAEFAATPYLHAISWLRSDSEDLYDPSYGDIIRIAGLVGFSRGRAASIVSDLSGRDPETRAVDEASSLPPTTNSRRHFWRSSGSSTSRISS